MHKDCEVLYMEDSLNKYLHSSQTLQEKSRCCYYFQKSVTQKTLEPLKRKKKYPLSPFPKMCLIIKNHNGWQ